MAGGTPNNRVTTSQFYEALLKQNDRMDNMERRIVDRLDDISGCLPKMENQVATNKAEIDKLRTKSNVNDLVVGSVAAIASAIAAVIGVRQ